jgi:hypothetical protein
LGFVLVWRGYVFLAREDFFDGIVKEFTGDGWLGLASLAFFFSASFLAWATEASFSSNFLS